MNFVSLISCDVVVNLRLKDARTKMSIFRKALISLCARYLSLWTHSFEMWIKMQERWWGGGWRPTGACTLASDCCDVIAFGQNTAEAFLGSALALPLEQGLVTCLSFHVIMLTIFKNKTTARYPRPSYDTLPWPHPIPRYSASLPRWWCKWDFQTKIVLHDQTCNIDF